MDPQTNLYLRYYNAQSGGALPTFNGARRAQYGSGLGDILRGIWRTIFPIAARGASSFLSEAVRAKDAGGSWGAAAKAAIAPTAQNVAAAALEKIASATATSSDATQSPGPAQSGKGRRGRRYNLRHQGRRARSGKAAAGQTGGYKRRHSNGHAKRRHPAKKIKFLNF